MNANPLARRWFLRDCTIGFGAAALHSLLARDCPALANADQGHPLAPKTPHFPGKAKRVIYLFQAGAPSHLELFDYKPVLKEHNGKLPPTELLKDYRAAFIKPNSALLGPKFEFDKFGACGMELSKVIPQIGSIADDICLIRTIQTDAVNHAPAQILMNTGNQNFGRPSFGSWTLYGLGTENQELPGFVVLISAKGTSGGASNYGSGFLPNLYGGVPFRSAGDPILYLSNPKGFDSETQRASLDTLRRMNSLSMQQYNDPAISARMDSYEMAYRLQTSAPDLIDLSKESQSTLDLYGIKDANQAGFARNCLLARRLVQRGVRFVQLFHEAWDHHSGLTEGVKARAAETDQASAALVKDLKQLGMLEDTLVIWGGEFGRTPMVQGGNDGRDHHNRCFSFWLAGGGVKSGYVHGETDEFGFNAVTTPVHVNDLNATLLHLLGFHHEKLSYRFQGLDMRLTGIAGNVVHDILA